ncbi:hypothetical protein [Pseudonocardia phyllosphaerae]|uniref:hypothetical protein n=1 Tax=Pseudonocardia phyllosphaerae TaxID=3390502 RepID=UPI00397B3F5D
MSTARTIRGGAPVGGEVGVSGFKHVMVLALAYLIGARGRATLGNVPDILETAVYGPLVRDLGVDVEVRGHDLRLDATAELRGTLPAAAAEIHGSLYLLPALLARTGCVRFDSTFGGCRIGPGHTGERPWRHVVDVLGRFGARLVKSGADYELRTDHLVGTTIDLRDYTVDRATLTGPEYSGASKAAILAAALAEGTTLLRYPYLKAEVLSLLELLRADGVGVRYDGTTLSVHGRTERSTLSEYRLPPDLLEVVTWVTVAAVTAGTVSLSGVSARDVEDGLGPELRLWKAVGVEVTGGDNHVMAATATKTLSELPDITTLPNSVYSDSQPLFAVLATRCAGDSRIVDTVWTRRYSYVPGLTQLGGRVRQDSTGITIGASSLRADRVGVDVHATDLRCAAALVTAALASSGGPVTVHGTHHLERGYDHLFDKLTACGAVTLPAPSNLEGTDAKPTQSR